MSESRLETVLALVTKLAGMVDDKPALAEDLAKLLGRYECMFCGELARDTVSLCAEREAARREFDRREAALDDEYSRRKDERGLEMFREARR